MKGSGRYKGAFSPYLLLVFCNEEIAFSGGKRGGGYLFIGVVGIVLPLW